MKKRIWLYVVVIVLIVIIAGIMVYQIKGFESNPTISSAETPDGFVLVEGGTFKNAKSSYYGNNVTIPDFYIGRYEITQKEWMEVMDSNPSEFKGDSLPVETVSWYDCVEYCNKRSTKEDLEPYYNIDKDKRDPNNDNDVDSIKWTVTIN